MRERGREPRIEDPRMVVLGRAARPKPNRLSDEATPNVLTGPDEVAASNVAPRWVRAAAAQRRTSARRSSGTAAAAGGSERSDAARANPSWFTFLIIGFILLSLVRACLQLG
jgi:hypothetical protein